MNNKNLFFNKSETIKILSIGNLEITYILNLTDNDINKYKIDFNSIQIADLDFLLNDSSILDRVIFSTDNFILNTIYFLNKKKIKYLLNILQFQCQILMKMKKI